MFYCDPCAKKNDWPNHDFLPVSYGRCEMCSQGAACFDVPSKYLPPAKDTSEQDAIESIKQTIEKRSE